MSGHAFLAPSGAERWGPGACPGSPRMEAQFPEEESEEAREGTAAHDYARVALTTGEMLPVGTPASNSVPITREMQEAGEEYIADCIEDRKAGGECYVEQHVHAHTSIHPLNDGTPDHFAVWRQQRRIKLKDYKYGHRYVDEFRNLQLANYLIAIFETLQLGSFEGWTIEAAIYQPRNYHPSGHVRVWNVAPDDLARIHKQLIAAAAIASQPEAPCQTGNHCRDCKAAHACTVLQMSTDALVDMSGKQWAHALDDDHLGRELTYKRAALKRLQSRVDALEEQAVNRIAQGNRVVGWTAEHSYGRERFTIDAPKVIAWCDGFGIDARAPVATKTPNQIRKLGLSDNMMPPTEKPRGAYTLVPVTSHTLAKGLSNGK